MSEDPVRTSAAWWLETKSDPAKLHHWLQRQYVGEFAAVHLLSLILLRYGSEMTPTEMDNVYRVMQQEALHGRWMADLLDAEGIRPEVDGDATRRYWEEVIPNVTSFREAMQAAQQAEHMRLYRIRAIAEDAGAPPHIRAVFQRILPHEEWHEVVFGEMRAGTDFPALREAHGRGLGALDLVLA
jgi:hypothetical protein